MHSYSKYIFWSSIFVLEIVLFSFILILLNNKGTLKNQAVSTGPIKSTELQKMRIFGILLEVREGDPQNDQLCGNPQNYQLGGDPLR